LELYNNARDVKTLDNNEAERKKIIIVDIELWEKRKWETKGTKTA